MNDNKFNSVDHPPENLIAAYAIGKCSSTVQSEIDEHCFICESCRTRLSILLRLCSMTGNDLERGELERLFPLGKETIAQARQPLGFSDAPLKNGDPPFSLESAERSSQAVAVKRFYSLKRKRNNHRYYQLAAISLFIVALAGASYYLYSKKHSPVQNSLLAMQRSYQLRRPLEARMSGDLEYKPYERTRGNLERADINRDQLDYALAELTRVVATNPTAQERHALGRLYLFLGEFDKAENQMTLAMESLKNDAKLHTDLAALYYERSNYSDASHSALLIQAVEHYRLAVEIDPNLKEAWFNRALCYEKLFLFSKAKEDWKQYLKIDPDSKWAGEARERLRKLEERATQTQPAQQEGMMAFLERAITSKDDEPLRLLVDQNVVTVIHFSSNSLFEKYINADLSGDTKQAELLLANLKKIGEFIAKRKGDNLIADLAALAARASPQMKNRMLSVHLKLRQADKEYSRSSHDAAFNLYKSAHMAAQHIGDELHAEFAASYLVRYSHLRPNSSSLISLGNSLVAQAERSNHRYLQAQIHYALANAHLASQHGTQALENSLRAADIAKQIGDKDTAINGLAFAGMAYTRTGNYKQGVSKSFEILSIIRDHYISRPRTFQIYQQIWELLFRSGDYSLALDFQEEALRTITHLGHKSGVVGAEGRIGLNLWKLSRNDEAETYLKNAISKSYSIEDKILRQLLQVELFAALGDVSLSLGKHRESLANFELALQAVKLSNNTVYLSAIYQGMASAHLAQRKIPEAEQGLRHSILLLERSRQQIADANGRSVFLARSQNAYTAMTDLQFYYKHDQISAFDYAEVARNRAVFDVLTNSVLPKTIDGRVVLPLSKNSRPLKLKEIQRVLDKNSQMISYALSDKGLIVWHVTSTTISFSHVDISPSKLRDIISEYIAKLVARQDIEALNLQASELYRLLISPIASHLNKNHSLYIVQDGVLAQLPFASLYSASAKRYLIEDYSIITNHGASVLAQTEKLARTKRYDSDETFIGISNPRFSNRRFPGLPSLPASEEEVTRITPFYKRSKSFSLDQAFESITIQQIPNYSIVHFASHTLNNADNSLTSSILLAEEQGKTYESNNRSGIVYDGTLQASEIYRLKLPLTKLVILSSCRSAIGDYTKGETVGALAQAFFSARVPSVIASLWDIDDINSSEVMYSFHRIHRKNKVGFAESLRQAQCSLLNAADKSKRHPYYWAAFQLLGSDIDDASVAGN